MTPEHQQAARIAFEDKYRVDASDPSVAGELAIWMAAVEWKAGERADVVPLSDEQIEHVLDEAKVPEYPGCETIDLQIARAIERAHGIGIAASQDSAKGGKP